MRVLVCGDRNWTNANSIKQKLENLPKDTVIIHGCARGADSIAGTIGKELRFTIEEYRADWDKHGKAAGPIRNRQMLNEGKPDLVLAFHTNISQSKGTKDMIKIAEKAGVEVRLFKE